MLWALRRGPESHRTLRQGECAGANVEPTAAQAAGACARSRDSTQAPAARRDCRRLDRVRVRRTGQNHQRHSRARHNHCMDRAYRPRPGVGGEPVDRHEFWPNPRPGCAARGHGGCQGARGLHGYSGIMTLLRTHNLSAFYGDFQALFDVSVAVEEGEAVAIIGANGAGKTTLLRSVAGAIAAAPEMVLFDGAPIGDKTPHEIVRLGIAMVP